MLRYSYIACIVILKFCRNHLVFCRLHWGEGADCGRVSLRNFFRLGSVLADRLKERRAVATVTSASSSGVNRFLLVPA
jgi:hypothetical protein